MSVDRKTSRRPSQARGNREGIRRDTGRERVVLSDSRRRNEHKTRQLPGFAEASLAFLASLKTTLSGFFGRFSGKEDPRRSGSGGRARTPGRSARDPRMQWAFIGIGAVLVLVLFISGLVWFLTNKNAVEVYMNGTSVGIVKEKVTADDVMQTAAAKLKDRLGGANVEIQDTITITLVHASSKEIALYDEVLSKVTDQFAYKVEAASIRVNGTELAIVATMAEADTILDHILKAYDQEDLHLIDSGFVEDVQKVPVFVNKEQIMANEKADEILTRDLDSEVVYEVVGGDMLLNIAEKNSMTLDEIQKLNPDLDVNGILKIGQQIVLNVPKPVLNVRTVESVTYPDVKKKTVDKRENPDQPKTYSRVIQQGSDGQRMVEEEIIRINGFEVERKFIKETVTIDPVPEIIEVGMK